MVSMSLDEWKWPSLKNDNHTKKGFKTNEKGFVSFGKLLIESELWFGNQRRRNLE